MTRGDLKAILDAGDLEACLAYFDHATETERNSVAAQSLECYKAQKAAPFRQVGPNSWGPNPSLVAADVAVLASCSLSELKKLGRNVTLGAHDFRILQARKPEWITDYATWSLEKLPAIWLAVRRLERAGLCRRPETDSYILGMIPGVVGGLPRANIGEALRQDPELIKREVWRLFEVEGAGEYSLAAHDKYCPADGNWERAIVTFAAEGKLPRGRLLDASLDALERDFSQFRAGWFSRFHEALEPTIDERAERLARYLNLLASKIPPTVSFALAALSKLERADRLSAASLVAAISPALAARAKGAVSAALKLLDHAANRDPALKQDTAMIAAQALTHESPDAQSEAFDLVVRCGDRSDVALVVAIRDRLDQLAVSIQQRVHEWLGSAKAASPASSPPAPAPEGELEPLVARASSLPPAIRALAGVDAIVASIRADDFDVEALAFDGTEIPRLDQGAAIQPIATLDELIDVFAAVLENPELSDDIERVLDGVSRLCAHRTTDFELHTRPLCKRATALLERGSGGEQYGPFAGWQPMLDLCGLALSWTLGRAVDPGSPHREEVSRGLKLLVYEYANKIGKWSGRARFIEHSAERFFLSSRALAVARRAAAGQAEPLLSAPTHRDGWLDPIVLVARMEEQAQAARSPDLLDQVQAILRLAPDGRAAAEQQLGDAAGEFAQAMRYALGGDVRTIGPTAALWIAAARARAPFDDDPLVLARHPNLGPDAGAAAKFGYRVKLESTGTGKTWACTSACTAEAERSRQSRPSSSPRCGCTLLETGAIGRPFAGVQPSGRSRAKRGWRRASGRSDSTSIGRKRIGPIELISKP